MKKTGHKYKLEIQITSAKKDDLIAGLEILVKNLKQYGIRSNNSTGTHCAHWVVRDLSEPDAEQGAVAGDWATGRD